MIKNEFSLHLDMVITETLPDSHYCRINDLRGNICNILGIATGNLWHYAATPTHTQIQM